MNIVLTLTGKSPLLMHDIKLADPDDDIVKQIKAITDKRKKTEQDRREIERLEWFGGLVLDNGSPAVKTGAVRKCFINAGKISKQGKQIERALAFQGLFAPLQYDGPQDVMDLWNVQSFRSKLSVGIGNKRVLRMRPQFVKWSVSVPGLILEDVIDLDSFTRIAERAGLAEGLGDNRANGYGRFDVQVSGS